MIAPTFKISRNTTGGKWELTASELMPIPTGLKEIFKDLDIVAEYSGDYIVQRRVLSAAILFKTLEMVKTPSSADKAIRSVYLHTEKYLKMPWEIDKGLQILWGKTD